MIFTIAQSARRGGPKCEGCKDRDAEIAALKANRYSSCDCCHETRTCVLVETGFAGEHELLCGSCLSRERHQAEDEIADLKRQLAERDAILESTAGWKPTGAALDAYVQEKVDALERENHRLKLNLAEPTIQLRVDRALEPVRVFLKKWIECPDCDCDHQDENCCVKVGEPCINCEAAKLLGELE